MKKLCLAVIPARSGSKGIKDKNTRKINGKPLIYYSIREAKKSKLIDKVIVSTDSKMIARVALGFGADVPFLRPVNLAKDTTPMFPVIKHAVSYLENKGHKFDLVIVLQPTSPLRTSSDIDKAINILNRSGADSVVSVCPVDYSPYWMKVIRNGRVKTLIKSKQYFRRQDLPPVYRVNGAIFATKSEVLFKQKSILGRDTRPLIMADDRSIDIDTELDLKLAEYLLSGKR